jgi:hypothetical protein
MLQTLRDVFHHIKYALVAAFQMPTTQHQGMPAKQRSPEKAALHEYYRQQAEKNNARISKQLTNESATIYKATIYKAEIYEKTWAKEPPQLA